MSDNNPHYVTPEEAEKKYCPLKYSDCIGPKCMAWRWQHLPAIEDGVLHFEPRYSTTHGYCGMVQS